VPELSGTVPRPIGTNKRFNIIVGDTGADTETTDLKHGTLVYGRMTTA
jgi:hypothetical protein